MLDFLLMISPVLLILTLTISVFVVGGVFVHKFKNSSDEKTYPRWRVLVLYAGVLCGYISGLIYEIALFNDDMSSLKNLVFVSFFYLASAIMVSFFAFKRPIGEDEDGQKIDYRSVQFFLVLALGFLPIILLSR